MFHILFGSSPGCGRKLQLSLLSVRVGNATYPHLFAAVGQSLCQTCRIFCHMCRIFCQICSICWPAQRDLAKIGTPELDNLFPSSYIHTYKLYHGSDAGPIPSLLSVNNMNWFHSLIQDNKLALGSNQCSQKFPNILF